MFHMLRKLYSRLVQLANSQPPLGTNRRLTLPENLEPRRTLSVSASVVDLSPTATSVPVDFVSTSLGVFFSASTPGRDRELYISDGTVGGTRLVRDIELAVSAGGTSNSSPNEFVELDGVVYFRAFTQAYGSELWRSDGTEFGTWIVADIAPGSESSFPGKLVAMNDRVYFAANDGVNGNELWSTDGTNAGTRMVTDINTGSANSNPDELTVLNNQLIFRARTLASGEELWRSDGTTAGTYSIADIVLGANSGYPRELTVAGSLVYFTAYRPETGIELWRSNGTGSGTFLLADIRTGPSYSDVSGLANVNNTLYFRANDGARGSELWKSGGTAATTTLVADINPGAAGSIPGSLLAVGGRLYFAATTSNSGRELWTSAGTSASTVLIQDTSPGTSSSSPSDIKNVGGVVYFVATTPITGRELFQTRGTASTTALAVDLNPGTASSNPASLVVFKDKLVGAVEMPLLGQEVGIFNTRPTVVIDNNQPGYTESDTWANSFATGYNNSTSRFSSQPTASATWSARSLSPGFYKVEFYKVVQTNNTATARLEIVHADGTTSLLTNMLGSGPSGWAEVGLFRFNGGATERVRMTNATTTGVIRADAVRFTPLDAPILIDFGSPGYSESGTFATSAVTGNAGSSTRASNSLNASVTYSPALTSGEYLVQIYLVVNANSTTNVGVSVSSSSGLTTTTFNPTTGTSRWVTLGTFDFDGVGSEFIRLRNNNTTGTLRADAIRLVRRA